MEISHNPSPNDRFFSTQWSVVLRAGLPNDSAQQALSELITAYWYPLYAFSRRLGNPHHDTMDLTQGFFTHLLSSAGLGGVSPEKGRFRSFLLSSFKNFMANQRRAAETARRGGTVATLSLDSMDFRTRYDHEPTDLNTPELLFQRRWVESLLERVWSRLADDYRRAGKEQLFELLKPHLSGGTDGVPRAEIGLRLNLSSAAIAMSIHRMRRRYGDLLRQEVAATVHDPADVEDEIRTLLSLVSGSS
jgi:DNA-directed RNA polymerase specialized sigma24 family protein